MAQAALTANMRDLLHELAATYERIAHGYTLIVRQATGREQHERAKTHHNQAGWAPSSQQRDF